jgi:hypothetical protein
MVAAAIMIRKEKEKVAKNIQDSGKMGREILFSRIEESQLELCSFIS